MMINLSITILGKSRSQGTHRKRGVGSISAMSKTIKVLLSVGSRGSGSLRANRTFFMAKFVLEKGRRRVMSKLRLGY